MEQDCFQKVAYIGLLNDDDTLKIGIPLYVKVKGNMSEEQKKLLYGVSSEMVRHYQNQISEYFASLKKANN